MSFLNIFSVAERFLRLFHSPRMAILLVFCLFSLTNPVFAQETDSEAFIENETAYASGKVIKIVSETKDEILEETFNTDQIVQIAEVVILNGKYRGNTVKIENRLTSNPIYDIKIKPGNRVILNIEETPEGTVFYIADIERSPVLLILVGIFLSLLMITGGKQGLRAIVSIVITAVLIFFVLIPAVLNNFPIIPATVGIAFVSTFITMFTVAGVNKKSLSASLGTIISVMIAGILSSLTIKFAPLNGFNTQESAMLWTNRPDLDFTGILTAGVIIASLGAIMDVGMSIASSIYELKKVNNTLSIKELFTSGLNVGKDITGTMSNTLILAYIGGSFSLVLLASNAPLVKLINLNSIAAEIASAVTGSIGIVLCVPITALIAAYLIGKGQVVSDLGDSQKIK